MLERKADLFQQPSFLDDISDCFHLYTFCLVDVFQSVELSALFVLHDPHLECAY